MGQGHAPIGEDGCAGPRTHPDFLDLLKLPEGSMYPNSRYFGPKVLK